MNRPLAIVTGASRGLGRSFALRLAADGYRVICVARSQSDLDALASTHDALIPLPLDLADTDAIGPAIDPLLDAHGPCELLINNAGYGLRMAMEDVPLPRWRHQFDVNLFSAMAMIQQVLPGMREARAGSIINVSSVAGRISYPFGGAYAATKFALEALSDALRVEVKQWGIDVVLVEPGPIATAFNASAADASAQVQARPDSPYLDNYGEYLRRWAQFHQGAWSAEDVVEHTLSAARRSSPPQRVACYGLNLRAALVLHQVLPRIFDRVIARRVGLTGAKPT